LIKHSLNYTSQKLYIKKEGSEDPSHFLHTDVNIISHEVLNANTAIVSVSANVGAVLWIAVGQCSQTLRKWVQDHAVAGLEANTWLEGVLTDCSVHLERYIWAIEQTSVISIAALVTTNVVLV